MFENYEWSQANTTLHGNTYYFYPTDEDEFKKEVAKNGGMIVKIYKNSKLIHSHQTNSSDKEWQSSVFTYLKTMKIQTSRFDQYFQDCEFYAVPKNYGYILDSQTEKISLTQEERELFSQALQELIFEVDECVKRDKRTKQDKISHAGTTSKNIKEHLSFLKKYGIDYQVGIGNSWGFLNPDSWIIFAPSKILNEKLVNGKILAPTRGVYVYFSYFGYLQGEKGYGLYFGFPNGEKNQRHGDPNKSQCVAVRKMQEDDALQTYDFTYTLLDFEKIINDFEAMMNYFMQFSSFEFTSQQGSSIPHNEAISVKQIPLNQILYGSPGTGKTYSTIDKALEILGIDTQGMTREKKKEIFEEYREKEQIEFVTFHQSYGYEEFVEGIKPLTDENKNVYYEVTKGVFKELCKRAQESQEKYILIIDEINRGNISKIFGELITLIESSKRIGENEELKVKLPYSQEEFGVPNNLCIIGTMNTADRSITSLDTALRRRFEFVEMMPKPSELSKIKVSKDGKEINLSTMLEFINKRIEFLYDREKTIGHAFFLQDEGQTSLDIAKLKSIFQNKIIPLLQEYFYNDYAQIQAVLNCNGMIEKSEEKIQDLFAMDKLGNELDLEDKAIYTIADKEDELWLNPQTYIDIYKKN